MSDATNPQHYKHLPAEAIKIILAAIAKAPSNEAAYLHGQTLKYLLRCWEKEGYADLRKAKRYLDWLVDYDCLAEVAGAVPDLPIEEPSKPAPSKTYSVEVFWEGPERPTRFYREPTPEDLTNGPIKCEYRDDDDEQWRSGLLIYILDSGDRFICINNKREFSSYWAQCQIEVAE